MDNRNCKVDFMAREIVVSKGFYRLAQLFGTEEYEMLSRLYKQYPEFRICFRKTQNNAGGWNPTYEDMKTIIISRSMNPDEALREFEQVCSVGRAMPSAYAYVRGWFMEMYGSEASDRYLAA